jgi:vacuolar-type H+-ATPase subunit D/Vma8
VVVEKPADVTRAKALKSSLRSLLKTIKGAKKMINHTLKDIIPRWWTHVNILMEHTIKKDILYIKL